MAEIKSKKLKLDTLDSRQVTFVGLTATKELERLLTGMQTANSVSSVTVDRSWWENNGKPLEVDVEVKISNG